jgi:protein-S-isoprenylcysteine O-methyltransferase Ste14
MRKPTRTLRSWLRQTPNRTFLVFPLMVLAFELAVRRGELAVSFWGLPLLAWGYLQYRLVGQYRAQHGGGGPGVTVPPDRLVQDGPYRYTRNPMYLGHLIFILGLAVTFRSWLAGVLFVAMAHWFHIRVRKDEQRLAARFGSDFTAYAARVKRWVPGVF